MKKILALPFLAIATMVSQAVAQGGDCKDGSLFQFCQWATGCNKIENQYSNIGIPCETLVANCKTDGALYTGASVPTAIANAPYGEGENCGALGLTKAAGGNEACGYDCYWGVDGGCWEIKTNPTGANGGAITTTCEAAIAACDKDGVIYALGNNCTGTPIGGIPSCNQWCKWPAPTGCIEIKPDPTGQYNGGVPVPDCATAISNCSANGSLFDTQAACNTTSIDNKYTASPLMAASFGRSLLIFSPRGATISLYDMSGAKVYSGKVPEGDRVFGLEKVASGSYYAIIQAGSDSKKIPVILK